MKSIRRVFVTWSLFPLLTLPALFLTALQAPREIALSQVVTRWADNDPAEAAGWVMTEPEGSAISWVGTLTSGGQPRRRRGWPTPSCRRRPRRRLLGH